MERHELCFLAAAEVHVFHRCVIAVIGVLTVSTLAAAGPIKLGGHDPSLELSELRANGVRMGQRELRAVFFPGEESRAAGASCADCLSTASSLRRLDREVNYTAVFPFSSSNLFRKPASSNAARSFRPAAGTDLLNGPAAVPTDAALVAAPMPLAGTAELAPLAVVGASAVPEPSTIALIGTGLASAWLLRRRRTSTHEA